MSRKRKATDGVAARAHRESDQDQRDRMIGCLQSNIAVRAAAGSGKTRSTVDRIVRMAVDPACREYLPKLVVVTYTNAAADELRTRARSRLMEAHHEELKKSAGDIIPRFSQIFFGTIHSFCMRLLREFGHRIDLPSELRNLADDADEVYDQFCRERGDQLWGSMNSGEILEVCRYGLAFEELAAIAKELSLLPVDCGRWLTGGGLESLEIVEEAGRIRLDSTALDRCKIEAKSEKIARPYQKKYKDFCSVWNNEDGDRSSISMLVPSKGGGRDIMQASEKALGRVNDWFARSVLKLTLRFAAHFQRYRWQTGRLTYNDQILLAERLVANRELRAILRGRDLRVVLDEAQDTTPAQFRILTELARPVEAGFGDWPSTNGALPPRRGHFVMVGDAQQCIYASAGADIDVYQSHGDGLEPVEFHVTFRCAAAVVEFVNGRFGRVLDGERGQALFVELKPKQGADRGCVGRLVLEADPELDALHRPSGSRRFDSEAAQLVKRLQKSGPAGLGAASWSEIAVLMPRNEWLGSLARHLSRARIPFRMTARRANREDAGWRWLVALLVVLARGDDGYELAGVLREIFGIRDSEQARWIFMGAQLDLELRKPPEGAPAAMAAAMNFLGDLRRRVFDLPALAAVGEILDACRLQERLMALVELDRVREVSSSSLRSIEGLRGRAAAAEAEGLSWRELAEKLAEESEADAPEQPPLDGKQGLVLMTCQKAKGQEWPVVLLPGLHRSMQRGGNDPRRKAQVLLRGAEASIRVKGAADVGWGAAEERSRRRSDQEMKRVYYVASTRAKRNLILVDARKIWPLPKKPGTSMKPIKAMSAEGENDDWFNKIGEWEAPLVQSGPKPADFPSAAKPAWRDWGSIRAVQVVHPSQGDSDRSPRPVEDQLHRPSREGRVEPLHGALVYGNWWHERMQSVDWSSKKVEGELRRAVEDLPEGLLRRRAESEIDRFLSSELFKRLTAPATDFHRELPYSRMLDAGTIEDGKIDLIFRTGAGHWSVLDWKTDLVGDKTEAEQHVRERYQSQMAAYMDALRSYGIEVESASLYFTTIGQLIFIST